MNTNCTNFLFPIVLLLLALFWCAPYSGAQAIAETATTTALSAGTTAAAAKTIRFPSVEITGGSGGSGTSSHLQTPSGPPPQIINRRAFEQQAGPEAGKLLIRSGTSISYVWIDDKYVGPTPVSLALAPGKHHLFLRGPRNESGDSVVDVPPRGTREVAPALTTPYRSKFTIR